MNQTTFAYSITGFNAVLTWMKVLKYVNIFPNVKLMTMTIASSVVPTMAFFVVFAVAFIGFAVAFTMCFGTGDSNYRTLVATMLALFRALLGDFDLDGLMTADQHGDRPGGLPSPEIGPPPSF